MCEKILKIPEYITAENTSAYLSTEFIGKRLIVLDLVTSTNDYIKTLQHSDFINGTVVVAREQSAGKGRLGRQWITKRDDCLAFSILLKPQLSPCEVSSITPLAGLAVCKAIRKFTGLDCKLKWPNDIIIGKKKLCGILTEMSADFNFVKYIVLGIGINISQADFPCEISEKATSIMLETGKNPDKNRFFATVLNCIEEQLMQSNYKLSQNMIEEYSAMCATIGRNVTFFRGTEQVSGLAVAINKDAELIVKTSDGSTNIVNSGEVTVQGIY